MEIHWLPKASHGGLVTRYFTLRTWGTHPSSGTHAPYVVKPEGCLGLEPSCDLEISSRLRSHFKAAVHSGFLVPVPLELELGAQVLSTSRVARPWPSSRVLAAARRRSNRLGFGRRNASRGRAIGPKILNPNPSA